MPLWLILFSLCLGCRIREAISTTPGLPLTVVRSYNSANPRDGDFGVGWSFALNDLDLEIDEERQTVTDFIDDEPFSLRVGGGRDVTLTLPDGRRTTFRYYLEAHNFGGAGGMTYKAMWQAEPGVTATLRTGDKVESEQAGDYMVVNLPAGLVFWWTSGMATPMENHDITKFVLTLQDDTEYHIEREDLSLHDVETSAGRIISVHAYGKPRVARIQRPNGEYLLVGKNAIDHYLPGGQKTRSLYFERGVGDRIVAIRDAQGPNTSLPELVRYEYDGNGNLVFVHKLQSKNAEGTKATYVTTTYIYGQPEFPHFISEVKDPRGIQLARNTYYPPGDSNAGKLKSITDARDAVTEISYPTSGFEGGGTIEDMVNGTPESVNYGTVAARHVTKVTPRPDQPADFIETVVETDQRGNVIFAKDGAGLKTWRGFEPFPAGQPSEKQALLPVRERSVVAGENNRVYWKKWAYQSTASPFSPTEITDSHIPGQSANLLRVTKLEYNIRGQVTKTFEPKFSGGTTTYRETIYAADGQVDLERSAGPQTITMADHEYYTSGVLKGLLRFSKDGLNNVTVYGYVESVSDPSGRIGDLKLVAVYPSTVNPESIPADALYLSKATFTHDAAGNQLTEKRWRYLRDGATGSLLFPLNPNAESSQEAAVTTSEYDAQGRVTKVTDATGATAETVYNSLGKVRYATDRFNATTSSLYDKLGELSGTQYPDGTLAYRTTYYDHGLRCQVVEDRHLPLSGGQTCTGTRTVFDRAGRAIRSERLNLLAISVNLQGEICETAFGSAQIVASTLTEYLEDGRVKKTIQDLDLSSTISTGDLVTAYDYSGDGLQKITRPPDVADVLDNDATIRTEIIEKHDLNNNLETTQTRSYRKPSGGSEALESHRPVTSFVYDQLNRRTQTKSHTDENDSTGIEMSQTDYDLAGRRMRETIWHSASETAKTKYDYDGAGRLVRVTAAEGTDDHTITHYDYDELGDLIAQFDGNQFGDNDVLVAQPKATRFAYDLLGRRTQRWLPAGGSPEQWTHDYTEAGDTPLLGKRMDKVRHTDFMGQQLVTIQDVMGRLDQKKQGTTLLLDIDYTAAGQRSRMRDNINTSERVTRYVYDEQNRLRIKNTPEGTLSYAFDSAGNLQTISARKTYGTFPANPPYDFTSINAAATEANNPSGALMAYSFDARNRLQKVNADATGADATYSYDAVGNRAKLKYRNGVLTTYMYNTRNQLSLMANSVASFKYHDDAWPDAEELSRTGRRNRADEAVAGSTRTVAYSYDPLQRLVVENMASGSPGGTITYDSSAGYADTAGYDKVGNRRTRLLTGSPGVPAQFGLAYDSNDRLSIHSYDNNGNTTAIGSTVYAHDIENRLINVAGTTFTIVYDGDGNRVSKTTSAGTVYFLVDDRNPTGYAQVMEERPSLTGSPTRIYVYGHNLIRQIAGGTTSYHGYDGHGSIRYLTDSSGICTDTYTYDAFGILVERKARRSTDGVLTAFANPSTETAPANTQPVVNFYRFAGEQWDYDIAAYYNRARTFDPNMGRFWTADSFSGFQSEPMSLHKYLYCADDPVNYVDPSGRLPIVSNFLYGNKVHQKISEHFAATGVGRIYNQPISSVLSIAYIPKITAGRPDLVQLPQAGIPGEVYEIKPSGSFIEGRVQLQYYLIVMNALDPFARSWIPGTVSTYTPPSMISLSWGVFAVVSPPVNGVILYQVVDVRLTALVIGAYYASQIKMDVAEATLVNTLAPAF